MANLAIIPARGGSKRIPRKNIKDFLGKPIISYSIEAVLKAELFDEVMVSTDDEEIAEVAIKYGAKVPFIRSKKNSDDFSGTGDVAFEVINQYEINNIFFDTCCCVYATAPLLSVNRVSEAYKLLLSINTDVVFPIAKFNSSIWRSYCLNKGTTLVEANFPQYIKSRSQDLQEAFFDAGQFYFFKTEQFKKLENKNIFGHQKKGIILDSLEVQDIDEEEDWEMAVIKFQKINKI